MKVKLSQRDNLPNFVSPALKTLYIYIYLVWIKNVKITSVVQKKIEEIRNLESD